MKKLFDKQIAIVINGSNGLGKAIANRLAENGAIVYGFEQDNLNIRGSLNTKRQIILKEIDITDEHLVQKNIRDIYNKHGRLDIMINCLGIADLHGNGTTNIGFDNNIKVNALRSFLITKYSVSEMTKRNYGRVLWVASVFHNDGTARIFDHSSFKSRVMSLTKALIREFAEPEISINGFIPAALNTELSDTLESEVKVLAEQIPLNCNDTLDASASLACWIVSEEANLNKGYVFDLSGH